MSHVESRTQQRPESERNQNAVSADLPESRSPTKNHDDIVCASNSEPSDECREEKEMIQSCNESDGERDEDSEKQDEGGEEQVTDEKRPKRRYILFVGKF